MDMEGDEIHGLRIWLKNYLEMELFARKVGMDSLDDWSFEDMMASFGSKEKSCSYDPTINTPKFKYPDIEFKKIGLSGVPRDGIYELFSYIISENAHYD